MVSKIFFILLIILLSMVGFAAYQNPQVVDFTLIRGTTFHVSLTVLVLFAFCLGALIVLVVSIIRDTKRSFRLRGERKAQKKEMEKISAYAVMLEQLMWGNVKDIENRLVSISKDFNEDGRFLRVKAELYKRKKMWTEAYQVISQLRLTQDPPKISTMMEEARLAKEAGLTDKARAVYEEILLLNATYLPALEGIREILESEEKWEEIIPVQERILKATSKKADEKRRLLHYRVKLARRLMEADEPERTLKGVELARSLLKKDPENRGLYALLGEYLWKAGKIKEAIKVWEKAYTKTKDSHFLALLESLFKDEGKHEEIFKRYGKAIRENPGNVVTAFFYARYCLENGKMDVARKVIEDLPEEARRYPFIRLLQARILAEEGQKESAYETCSEVVKDEKWMDIPLICRACGASTATWSDICPHCGAMNTIAYDLK